MLKSGTKKLEFQVDGRRESEQFLQTRKKLKLKVENSVRCHAIKYGIKLRILCSVGLSSIIKIRLVVVVVVVVTVDYCFCFRVSH